MDNLESLFDISENNFFLRHSVSSLFVLRFKQALDFKMRS